MAAVATAAHGIYVYQNYLAPADDQKLWIVQTAKLFKDATVAVRAVHIVTAGGALYLFIVTDLEVVSFNLSENCVAFRDPSETKFEASCRLRDGLVGVCKGARLLVYNAPNGLLKCISADGQAAAANFASERSARLHGFNEYLVSCNIDNIFDNNNIILVNAYAYALDFTFVACSYHIPRLVHVAQAMNSLYLLTSTGGGAEGYAKGREGKARDTGTVVIFELRNKRVYERIELLIRKRLFDWAIKLARAERRPANEVEEIYKIYGDWLFAKNKHGRAIRCYCRSGGAVEPCYVIQRFLALNSTAHLYRYLFHLHATDRDNYILTVLLIQALSHIRPARAIGATVSANGANGGAVPEAGAAAGGPEDEDPIELDGRAELCRFLGRFGKSHRASIKEAIVECRNTNKYEFASLIARSQDDQEEYLNILIEDLGEFERAYELLERADAHVKYQTVVRHYKLLLAHNPAKLLGLIEALLADPGPLGPDLDRDAAIDRILNLFVLENEFLVELLGVIGSTNSLMLYTIRLNILLQRWFELAGAGEEERAEREKLEDSTLTLLNSSNRRNELVGLTLCLLYNYKRGAIAMSIKMGHYNLPLVLLDNADDSINLLEYAFDYGYNEPILYINILKLLLKYASLTRRYGNYDMAKKLLLNIQNYKLLKYQNIIGIFDNYDVQCECVRDYVGNEFRKINDAVSECNHDIRQDKLECMNMKRSLANLNSSFNVINNVNCSACGLHLEYPSVHFYCKHSFHIYCIGQDNACPKCAYSMPDNTDNEDNFFKFLIGSNDPFDYISQQFSKFLNI